MLKYGLSNLRRLRTVPPIELRPITILVGRNSSGKSTYLRSLALLRQSITTRTSSPILWYGDQVDFGSYEVSISDRDQNTPIDFTFAADRLSSPEYRLGFRYRRSKDDDDRVSGVQYTVTIVPKDSQTRISKITLSIASLNLIYTITVKDDNEIDALTVNGKDVRVLLSGISLNISSGYVFPDLHAVRKREQRISLASPVYSEWLTGPNFRGS